jgi:hypothetical protein
MANSECESSSDSHDITEKSTVASEVECQGCAKLKLELNNMIYELKSAMKIIGILKEELGINDMEDKKNITSESNIDSGINTPRGERNWILIQGNQHKEKIKDCSATILRTYNRFDVLTNPNITMKSTVSKKCLTTKSSETTFKSNSICINKQTNSVALSPRANYTD